MDKRFLEDCLAKGLSLDAIAELVGRHPSTVSYWLRSYGLEPLGAKKHAARGGLSRSALQVLVEEGLTIEQIAQRVGRSDGTVRHWLRKYGLRTTGGKRRTQADEARRTGLKRLTLECPKHGSVTHVVEPSRVRCVKCRAEAVSRRRRKVKRLLIDEAGGRCANCGYDRCAAALEFHHIDPATKSFNLSVRGITRSIEKLRREASKCVLLCANCHAEVENGFTEVISER